MSHHRIKSVVHYVCEKCSDSPRLGSVKLNKILWYADIDSYMATGKTITGASYIKQRLGPVLQDFAEIREEMERDGLVQAKQQSGAPTRARWNFVSLQSPNMDGFSQDEIAILDDVIAEIHDSHSADSISEMSHGWAWEIAEMEEEIPIYTCLLGEFVPPDARDREWADGVLSQLGQAGA